MEWLVHWSGWLKGTDLKSEGNYEEEGLAWVCEGFQPLSVSEAMICVFFERYVIFQPKAVG